MAIDRLMKQNIIDALEILKKYKTNDSLLKISESMVYKNWEAIKSDPYNNRPDIETPDDYISECKKGNVTAGGVKVVIT